MSPVKQENKHAATKARGYKLFAEVREKKSREAEEAKGEHQSEDYLGYKQGLQNDSPRHS